MSDLAKSVLSSVLGGIVLALLFFVWNDVYWKRDTLMGVWTLTTTTESTTYDPYVGMVLTYDVILVQQGSNISGTGEKTSERTRSSGSHEYQPANRVRVELEGAIRYRFFASNLIDVHLKEQGRERETSSYLKLEYVDDHELSGTFLSTAADSRGTAVLRRHRNE